MKRLFIIALIAALASCTPFLGELRLDPYVGNIELEPQEPKDPFAQEVCCQYWHFDNQIIATCVTTDGSCELCYKICKDNPIP